MNSISFQDHDMSSATHAILDKTDDVTGVKFEDLPSGVKEWTDTEAWNQIIGSAS